MFDTGGMARDAAGLVVIDPADLQRLARAVRPTSLAGERTLPVLSALQPLMPHGGLARGSVVDVSGPGSTSFVLALAAGASRTGSWLGFVGDEGIGWAAAARRGIAMSRTIVVPDVPSGQWSMVGAALLDALDIVVVAPSWPVRQAAARRLAARGRERGSVLLVLATRFAWPEPADLTFTLDDSRWAGLGDGHGHLRSRRVTVHRSGRRAASQRRDLDLWLPADDGEITIDADSSRADPSAAGPGDPQERHLRAV